MKKQEAELIAIVLGDADALKESRGRPASVAGRRELTAYRRTVNMLRNAYGDVTSPEPKAVAYYASMRAPIGRVWVATTDAGLVRVSFRRSEASFIDELRRRLRGDIVKSAAQLAPVVAQLEAYFAGRRRVFDLPIDLRMATPFQRRVLTATRSVPAGQVVPYGEIARRIAQPKASRAVGQALGHNPVPIVIPCHRVVAGGGRMGGYTGGLTIKKKLLAIEGALAA
jgi:methylated-DNA-[protein]-cysteine S-methyltransferase